MNELSVSQPGHFELERLRQTGHTFELGAADSILDYKMLEDGSVSFIVFRADTPAEAEVTEVPAE